MNKKRLTTIALLVIAGGVAFWGGTFINKTIGDELSSQKISFSSKDQLEKEGDSALAKYGGQKVNTGNEAKAYAEYINGHLQKVANGKTYSEVSTLAKADPKNATLAGQKQTLFMGETLRGLLLNAWGWSVVGMVALYVSYALFVVAVILLVLAFTPKSAKAGKKSRSSK